MTIIETIVGMYNLHLDVTFPGETFRPLPKFTVEKNTAGELVVFTGHITNGDRNSLCKALHLFSEHTGLTVIIGDLTIVKQDYSKLFEHQEKFMYL